jgi:hypothetical protein
MLTQWAGDPLTPRITHPILGHQSGYVLHRLLIRTVQPASAKPPAVACFRMNSDQAYPWSHRVHGNDVRFNVSIAAYNGNLWRRLAVPVGIED